MRIKTIFLFIILTIVPIACSSNGEHKEAASLFIELIGIKQYMKTSFYPVFVKEMNAGLERETTLITWQKEKKPSGTEVESEVKKNLTYWLSAIESYDYDNDFEKITMRFFTVEELNTINNYLQTGSGKKFVQLLTTQDETTAGVLNGPEKNIASYFADDLDNFSAFSNTTAGRKLFKNALEGDYFSPEIFHSFIIHLTQINKRLIDETGVARLRYGYKRETGSIIVANRNLQKGSTIGKVNLAIREYAKTQIPGGSVHIESFDFMDGGKLLADVKDGDPVSWVMIEHGRIIVPAVDLGAGTILDRTNLSLRAINSSKLKEDYLFSNDFPQVEYAVLNTDTLAGQPVLKSFLTPQTFSCDSLNTLMSFNSGKKIDISFHNTRKEIIELMWIDYTGKQIPYGSIAVDESKNQSSFARHPWVLRDKKGKCLKVFNFSHSTKVHID